MIGVGKVTPPADLGPAIAELSEAARERMYASLAGREPTSRDVAQAADWERGEAA